MYLKISMASEADAFVQKSRQFEEKQKKKLFKAVIPPDSKRIDLKLVRE
jgi:hypothetical protein